LYTAHTPCLALPLPHLSFLTLLIFCQSHPTQRFEKNLLSHMLVRTSAPPPFTHLVQSSDHTIIITTIIPLVLFSPLFFLLLMRFRFELDYIIVLLLLLSIRFVLVHSNLHLLFFGFK
jgi:hypothetical protein